MIDIDESHVRSWRAGKKRFGYRGLTPVTAVGMVIGEAPGQSTDRRMPLFPAPNSAGARLLKYTDVEPIDWMGKLIKVNLCDRTWSGRRSTAGRAKLIEYLLDKKNHFDGSPLRVLLLGARVARAWSCYGAFGYVEMHHHHASQVTVIEVAWIPHPSGRNRLYNARRNQLRARRAVLWAMGERDRP